MERDEPCAHINDTTAGGGSQGGGVVIRFGYAIKLGGDREISGALAAGIQQAMEAWQPMRVSPAVRRLDMRRHTPEEWREMTRQARRAYAIRRQTPLWARRLLLAYALGWLWVRRILTGRGF